MIDARWDHTRGAVQLRAGDGHLAYLFPSQAAALVGDIQSALAGDEDPTPTIGVKVGNRERVQAIQKAWTRFAGDMVHGVDCPAKHGEVGGQARTKDESCTCGLRALVMALEGHA